MTQQHSAFTSKSTSVFAKKEAPESFQTIMADSVEVMEYYYRGKIQELEQSMAQLTILENAREISSLCQEVVRTKEILQKIFIKKGARRTIQTSVK
jgi:hypothetical protein